MLIPKEFDGVLLKDGREGAVVHIYDVPGLPLAFEVELLGTKMETITVEPKDIQEITYHHHK